MACVKRAAVTVIGFALCICTAATMADIVAVVPTASPVQTLSNNQVADIFLGKTSRFPTGGHAIPIDQVEDSPQRDAFYMKFTGKSAAQLKAHWLKIIFTGRGQPPRAVSNSAEVKKLVAQNPNAIGYIDSKDVDDSVRVLTADTP
ncbi:MAG: phosphate ABC transporter substrate-binding protein [Pseudomonas sp.]|uniref:phosphate ABC transporter substrate-binding protein n=1 Tax=Pseudomonas sp. TaxID=306 RepID=UPI002736E8DE|nr:phosphate ABC transporter substrate-binding protein [Pseudomonas sp.]MDP3846612.1 phosphate ABC transporter substrate-binding protein [Pseudomonas sp.]